MRSVVTTDQPYTLTTAPMDALPDSRGRFGLFGGKYVPETLMSLLEELEQAYREAQADPAFHTELQSYLTLTSVVRRPLLRQPAERAFGWLAHFLKREDLNHTAHKINNALGQALLTRHAETSHHR